MSADCPRTREAERSRRFHAAFVGYFLATKDTEQCKTVAIFSQREHGEIPLNTSIPRNYTTIYHGKNTIGKDEVGGSNPPSSSKKSCFLSKTGLFLCILVHLICGSRCGSKLPHTLPHTRKCAERDKEHRRGSSVASPVFLSFSAFTSPVP